MTLRGGQVSCQSVFCSTTALRYGAAIECRMFLHPPVEAGGGVGGWCVLETHWPRLDLSVCFVGFEVWEQMDLAACPLAQRVPCSAVNYSNSFPDKMDEAVAAESSPSTAGDAPLLSTRDARRGNLLRKLSMLVL